LSELNQNIRRYVERATHEKEIADLLRLQFDDYSQTLGASYHALKTSDHVSRYRYWLSASWVFRNTTASLPDPFDGSSHGPTSNSEWSSFTTGLSLIVGKLAKSCASHPGLSQRLSQNDSGVPERTTYLPVCQFVCSTVHYLIFG